MLAALPVLASMTLWHTQDRAQAAILARLTEAFTRETGLSVALETGLDIVEALVVQVEAGAAPGVVLGPSDLASLAGPLGLAEIPPDLVRGIDSSLLATVSLDGRVYGVPVFDGNHLLVYYDKKRAPGPPRSWEEMKGKVAMHFDAPYNALPFLFAEGGAPARAGKSGFAEPACERALAAYIALADTGVVTRRCDYGCATDDFFDRKHVYAVNGDWILRDAVLALGDDLGVAPLPPLHGKALPAPRMTHALFFPAKSLDGNDAVPLRRLARHFASPEVQSRWFVDGGRLPAATAARADALAATAGPSGDALRALAGAATIPNDPKLPAAWVAMRRGIHLAAIGLKTPAEACAMMHRLVEEGG